MSISRKELLRVLGVILLAWVILLLALGKWQQRQAPERVGAEPELVHYPGTEGIQEQLAPNLGFRKYWFRLNEDYPSKSVFYFYQNEMGAKGWQLVSGGEPQWRRRESKDEIADLFHATWLSPDRLFQLDVEMVSRVKLTRQGPEMANEEREPGIRVYVTLRRVSMPGLMVPGPPKEPRRGEIELH